MTLTPKPAQSIEQDTQLDIDDEMLPEYDFSQGRKNPYYQRYQQSQPDPLPGVEFVTNATGQKTGVLLNLRYHQQVWANYSHHALHQDILFLTDTQGHKIAVLLKFDSHLQLWQQIYDELVTPA